MRASVHDEVAALLPAYVAHTLPKVRRDLVAQHLRRCAVCQAEFSRLRTEGVAEVPSHRSSLLRLAVAAVTGTLVGWTSWVLRRRR